ncbi:MFS transporter [Kitasatospora sp. NPDC048540]|uniref:MFS transporter n=1 Tax=unclassified Kitasatospora TaxID=2633591 RepID=UPI00068966F9|nr:MFS transporter [Kitasatospora sp. MBT63]
MANLTAERAAPARPSGAWLFWRYWTASTVSNVGNAVTAVALPLVAVETLKVSSLQVSFITAASYAAWILIGLPAGVLVQRFPLRATQVAMDLLRAGAIASVPVAAAFGALSLAQLVVVALVIGLANVVFDVGNSSFLPSIVSKEELTSRNSLTSVSGAATDLGGPSLGGVLVQLLGAASSLVVDAISYLASAVLLWTLPRPERGPSSQDNTSFVQLIKDGVRYVVRHPVMAPCVAVATLINFVAGAQMALAPVFLVRTLGAPASLVGVLIATQGIGSLVGAAWTPRLSRRIGSARAVLVAITTAAVATILMPLAGHGWLLSLFALGSAGFTAGVVVVSILTRTHRQTVTPADLLPRVMATVRFISWGAIPFGALAAGLTSSALGIRAAFWLCSLVIALAPTALFLSPVRRLRDLN